MKKCPCKPCNPKHKTVKIVIPIGFNWLKTDKVGRKLTITFVEIIK